MKGPKSPQRRSATRFSLDFKKEVIDEYLRTGKMKTVIEKKYGIKSHGMISKWLNIFGLEDPYREKEINLEVTNYVNLAKERSNKSSGTSDLEIKIRLLEKQLEDERLKSEMYARMIDLAEEMYKIPVRKNYNTK